MNAVAFFTYIVKFPAFKSMSFMAYTPTELDFVGLSKIQNGNLTFKSICSLTDVCTWNLRPGMNAAAIFTPRIIFSEFKLVSFMAYTYNMNMTQLKIQDGDLTFELICSLTDVCTWNLRPGMNSVANFTHSINFSEFKLVSFMAYTYTELDLAPMMWRDMSQGTPCETHFIPHVNLYLETCTSKFCGMFCGTFHRTLRGTFCGTFRGTSFTAHFEVQFLQNILRHISWHILRNTSRNISQHILWNILQHTSRNTFAEHFTEHFATFWGTSFKIEYSYLYNTLSPNDTKCKRQHFATHFAEHNDQS